MHCSSSIRPLFAGPIAMVVDRNSVIPLAKGKGEQKQPMLYIRSAAGELVIYYNRKRLISVTELHNYCTHSSRRSSGSPHQATTWSASSGHFKSNWWLCSRKVAWRCMMCTATVSSGLWFWRPRFVSHHCSSLYARLIV